MNPCIYKEHGGKLVSNRCLTGRDEDTAREGITREGWRTGAGWAVVRHNALSVHPACALTRVHALVAGTRLVTATVRINHALESTKLVWVTKHSRLTGAHGNTCLVATLRPPTTRVRITGASFLLLF